MKILYCHDNIYIRAPEISQSFEDIVRGGAVYSEGQFSYSYWSPYIQICDELVIAGRGRAFTENDDLASLNQSNGDKVTIETLPNMNSPLGLIRNRAIVQKRIEALVEDSDALIVRTMSEIGWLAFKHAQKLGKPIAHEIAGCPWDNTWNHGSLLAKCYAPLRAHRMKYLAQQADYVLYVSKDFLPNRYPANGVTAIASNVRIARPSNLILEDRLKRIQSKLSSDLPIEIGLIGQLDHKLKGINIAIEALSLLNTLSERRFVLKILGAGQSSTYQPFIHKHNLQNNIQFEGVLTSGAPVLNWLDYIDLYIQPSFHEGVPRATIEAMSRGCPAFGSDAGGIPELLPPNYIHKAGNAKQLAIQILQAVTEETLETQARENFKKSLSYTQDVLQPIRNHFWSGFANHIKESKSLLS